MIPKLQCHGEYPPFLSTTDFSGEHYVQSKTSDLRDESQSGHKVLVMGIFHKNGNSSYALNPDADSV